jgi:tetratricopeptide (TPR) repeat protein
MMPKSHCVGRIFNRTSTVLVACGALTFTHARTTAAQTSPATAQATGAQPAVTQPAVTQPAGEVGNAGSGEAVNPVVKEAAEHYDRGLKLHAEGDFALAAIEFERAYELVPDYRALYNIGQVRLQLGNYAKARRALTRYLQEGGDKIPDDRKQAVANDLDMLGRRTGTIAIEVNVPGAEVQIDGVAVGQTPFGEPLLLDAGEHTISVRKTGYQAKTSQVTLLGGDALKSQVTLDKLSAQPEKIIIEREVQDSNRSAWMWGMWTGAGVLAIASGITEGLGVKAAHDLDDKRGELGTTRSELDSASRRARTLLTTGDILGALAIAAGGTAVYLTLSGPDENSERAPGAKAPAASAQLFFTPYSFGVRGSY